MDTRRWHCPSCDDVRAFVQPPCAEGHTDDGGDCPEWACTDCGTAVVTEVDPAVLPAARMGAAA